MTMFRHATEMKDSGVQEIGSIPNEWDCARIARIIENSAEGIMVGPFGSSLTGSVVGEVDGQYKVYGQANLIRKDFDYGDKFIDEAKYNELLRYKVIPGDIAISMMGTVGKCMVIPDGIRDGIMDSHLIKARLSVRMLPKYFEYIYESVAVFEQIMGKSTGTIMTGLNSGIVKSLYVVVPSIEEQRAIASYLDDRCSKLDEIIAEAEKSIEEYKELKQAVIFEAVTKGLDKNVSMRDSGVEWLPRVPASWDVRRIASIYEESKETGRDDLPILLVSIHTGISDREIDDEERDRKVIRSEDKTVYKVVHKNYLAYNMMRAWQGGFGAAIVDGLVSPAYVVAKPKIEVNSSYVEHVLRTPNAIEHIRGLSYGVADFRLRLYWPYFKNIKIPLPPIEEQNKIVSYIQDQSNKMDALISEKQSLIEDLKAYKKSLIYEVVTGKRRVV